jgi:hypothetical protein
MRSSGQKLYDSASRKTFGTLSTQNQKTEKGKYPEILSSYDGAENNREGIQNSAPYLSPDSVGLKSSNSLGYHHSGK